MKGVSHLAICGVTRPTLFAGIFSFMSEPENQTRRQADGECGVSETNLHDVNADKQRIGEKSMPPILGSSERKGAMTGSETCQISSMAGCRLPGAIQLTTIMAIRMKK